MTTGDVTTCYITHVAFDLQKNPAYDNVFRTVLITREKSSPRPLLRDRPPQHGRVSHFTIDSCSRFLDKRQRPI